MSDAVADAVGGPGADCAGWGGPENPWPEVSNVVEGAVGGPRLREGRWNRVCDVLKDIVSS